MQSLERDPHGLKPSDPGAKLDVGKIDFRRALEEFPLALDAVSRIGDFGAKKYSDKGWVSVPDGINRYKAAELRHMSNEGKELLDPDSSMPHAAHRAWNALASLELLLRELKQNSVVGGGN